MFDPSKRQLTGVFSMEQKSFPISILGNTYQGIYIKDWEVGEPLLQQLWQKDCLFAIDTETTPELGYEHYPKAALSPHLSRVRLIQIFDGKNSLVFDMNTFPWSGLLPFLEAKRFIAHNAIFDLQYFMKMTVKKMNIGCTLLLARLLVHATRPVGIGLSLEALSENVLSYPATKKMGDSNWGNPDLTFEQVEYAAIDPILTLLLAQALAPGLSKYGLERVYQLHKDAQHPVASMQLNGLGIDVKAHEKNVEKWRDEVYQAKEDVLEFTQLEKLTGHTLADWLEGNLEDSVLNIWPKTAKGKLKTDAHTFVDFSHATKVASKYSQYQKKEKLLSSFGDNLLRLVNPATKRLHASYFTGKARTGRMSCGNPNLMQIPRFDTMRDIFVPGVKGEVFVSADFSQIELRCAAEISRDKAMLQAYRDGDDLHELTARTIMGEKRWSRLTKEEQKCERQKAKAFNFGLLFGLGHKKFSHYALMSYGVEITEDEARRSIEIWRELYSGYRAWQLSQAETCEDLLYATTLCGKRQRLTSDNFYGTGLNHPVQGTAAEILLHAIVRFDNLTQDRHYRLVNTVHDEITVQCAKVQAKKCAGLLEECMIQGYLDVFPYGITLNLVEAKIGNSWGEVK